MLLIFVRVYFTASNLTSTVMFVIMLKSGAANGAVHTNCRQLSAGGRTYDLIIPLQFN